MEQTRVDLHLARHGAEGLLARELEALGEPERERGPGWVLSEASALDGAIRADDLCFASSSLLDVTEVKAPSIKQLANGLAEAFTSLLADRRVDTSWPISFEVVDQAGLADRGKLVEARWRGLVKRRRARVLRLAQAEPFSSMKRTWGFFVVLLGLERAFCAVHARAGGQRRMRMDPAAPSRSYLKAEEAFALWGSRPVISERVVDLGAAPGGWSYAAARGGAKVFAVDNGPLKGAAAEDASIEHVRANAFTYQPPSGQPVDWMLCDMIEDPDQVLSLLLRWLERGWCRRFVVNIKFGRGDPLRLLQRVRDEAKGPAAYTRRLIARQLFHDRDELTLIGETRSG